MAKPKRQNPQNSLRAGFPNDIPKAGVYAALAGLNLDFEKLLVELERLGELGLFPRRWQRKFLKACRATLEETRAWTNFEVLHQVEEGDWVRFARIRQRAEKPSELPGDVLLPTEPRTPKSKKGHRP